MKERRKADRFSLRYYTSVINTEANQKLGDLVDISAQGAMLVSDTPIPTGQTLFLRLPLDEDVFEKPALEFKALSIWCHPDMEPNLYNIGLEILDLPPEDRNIISRIAVRYGIGG